MENKFDLVTFKKNVVEKMPFIMERSIAYFSQVSSFDKFGEIIVLVSMLEVIGKNPISVLDTKEEVEKYSTEDEMSKFIVLANIFTDKIDNLYIYLREKTPIYDELDEIKDMQNENLVVEESSIPLRNNKESKSDGW